MFEAVEATEEIFLVLNSRGRVQLVRPLWEYIAVPRDAVEVNADNCLVRHFMPDMPFALAPTIIGPTHAGLPLGLNVGTILYERAAHEFLSPRNKTLLASDELAQCSLGVLSLLQNRIFQVALLTLVSFIHFHNSIPLLGSALSTVGEQTTLVSRIFTKLFYKLVLSTFAAEMDRRLLFFFIRRFKINMHSTQVLIGLLLSVY